MQRTITVQSGNPFQSYLSFPQAPDAEIEYVVDWTAELGSDTISASSWTSAGATGSVTLSNEATPDSLHAAVWISGGTLGTKYKITNSITTAAGFTEDKTFTVVIVQT